MIVMKFGGSSVDTAEAIARVAGIIRDRLDLRPLVVISAMGKTTRHLLESAEAAASGDLRRALMVLGDLTAFHHRVVDETVAPADREALDARLDPWFAELEAHVREIAATRVLTPRASDAVAGYGELLASALLTSALRREGIDADWIDCRRALVTDHGFTRARPLYGPTEARLREMVPPILERGAVPVVGGYVGATLEGVPTTLGREGSDFSAAIVGAALGADEVLIWTDVDGMLTADPRMFPGARRIRTLSFAEALELACSGAKKPHYGTLGPASRAGVCIRILNSRHPEAEGTLIGRRNPDAPPTIKSIACRIDERLISARALRREGLDGFLPRMFGVCETFRPALVVLGADGEGGLDLGLSRADRLSEIHPRLREAAGPSADLDVQPGRAVISLVSEDFATHPELVERTLEAARDFEPRLVLTGGAAPCVRLLADEADLAAIVASLHERLLPGSPDEVVE
jgi:aspartate kinase